MASPLLSTKLFMPQPRHTAVARPRLDEQLDQARHAKLTLVSAPAGFGKTTAVTRWLSDGPGPERVAWLSLEESDRLPETFWTYLVTALQVQVPGLGASVLPLLQSGRSGPAALTIVLNELATAPQEIYLVLDDYHQVDQPDIASGLTFLIDHLPPNVHVVMLTRTDPDLPLGRLRARGELVEVRAADLRFTAHETTRYLGEATDLDLADADITILAERTEGWIAALQLAALSMRGRADAAGFIAGFAGDDRYIVDYLVEEVLSQQRDEVRDFLIQTSILDRLTGPLCDAVTGQHRSQRMLESLDRANLFLVPLDDQRRWYRYHHLFADVLRTHLGDGQSVAVEQLHNRASRWYADGGQTAPAVRHALSAGETDLAADLVEAAAPGLMRDRQEAVVRGWLDDIPDQMVQVRPVLAIGFIAALMSRGEFDDVPRRLRDVEPYLRMPVADPVEMTPPPMWPPPGMRVVDEAELPRLAGRAALYWTGLALVAGDVPGTHLHAQQAIDRAAPDDHVTRAGAAALSALAHWATGDLQAALRGYLACIDGLHQAGNISDVLGCTITVADLQITQGQLSAAQTAYEQALELAAREPGILRGTGDMFTGMSGVALERGDVEAAVEHARHAQELGDPLGLPQNPYRQRVAMAELRVAHGDLDAALSLLDDAERVYTGDYSPNVRPIHAMKARVLARQGRVEEALAWAAEHDLSADQQLSYVREFEHLTLARVLLAEHRHRGSAVSLAAAADLLRRLRAEADQGGRTGTVIEVLVLLALTRHAQGDASGAAAAIEEALVLAEPEGYVQVFAAEGPPMVALLGLLPASRRTSPYLRRLLAACARPTGSPAVPVDVSGQLVDQLSARELEVLRLLAGDLDGPNLARHLVVSLNTLRTHTKSIYAKLGVNSRRAAVRRAGELGLLAGRRDR